MIMNKIHLLELVKYQVYKDMLHKINFLENKMLVIMLYEVKYQTYKDMPLKTTLVINFQENKMQEIMP